jgi:hypothetical protein
VGGGFAGADDRFVLVQSIGVGGLDSRMIFFNTGQWTGDYVAAGVTRIEGRMRNSGAEDLFMRIAIDAGGGLQYGSTTAIQLPRDGIWHPVAFDLTPSAMKSVGFASGTLETALQSVVALRILSARLDAAFRGDFVTGGELGVDDLRAMTLPGDADRDGRVTFVDFQRLELGFGATAGATWDQGDFNFDGRVDFSDFQILRGAFGSSIAGSAPGLSAAEAAAAVEAFAGAHGVPEPSGFVILMLGAVCAFGRYHR